MEPKIKGPNPIRSCFWARWSIKPPPTWTTATRRFFPRRYSASTYMFTSINCVWIQISIHEPSKRTSARQKVALVRALTTHGFGHLSICQSSAMDSLSCASHEYMCCWRLGRCASVLWSRKVRQYLVFFLSFFIDSTRRPATSSKLPAFKSRILNHKHPRRHYHELHAQTYGTIKNCQRSKPGVPSTLRAIRSRVALANENLDLWQWREGVFLLRCYSL